MQAIQNTICLICTARTFKKTISRLTSFNQHHNNNNYFVLLLDEPGNIDQKKPDFIHILYPENIGLQKTEWTMIVFENNCSKACLAIMPYFNAWMMKKNYQTMVYLDFRLITKKLIELISTNENDKLDLLRNRIPRDAVITHDECLLMIYKNIWKDNDFFYRFYSDHTAISKEDRIKYSNMHILEKGRLDNPFNKKNEIRKIRQIVGSKKNYKSLFMKRRSSQGETIFLTKNRPGIDSLIEEINVSTFASLSFYVCYKIIRKIITHSYLFISNSGKKSNQGLQKNG